jgi:hypothetical protein
MDKLISIDVSALSTVTGGAQAEQASAGQAFRNEISRRYVHQDGSVKGSCGHLVDGVRGCTGSFLDMNGERAKVAGQADSLGVASKLRISNPAQ